MTNEAAVLQPHVCKTSTKEFREFRARVAAAWAQNLAEQRQIYRVKIDNAGKLFRRALPEAIQQRHRCSACEQFLDVHAGLVIIGEDGHTHTALFHTEPMGSPFYEAAMALANRVRKASIIAPFHKMEHLHDDGKWRVHDIIGDQNTDDDAEGFVHFYLRDTREVTTWDVHHEQVANRGIVQRAIEQFPLSATTRAMSLVNAKTLNNPEIVEGPLLAFHSLRSMIELYKDNRLIENAIWEYAVKNPPAFCHLTATMTGNLLSNIVKGASNDQLVRMFNKRTAAGVYDVPVAAATDGQINAAERLVEKFSIAPALPRKFAVLDTYPVRGVAWAPRPVSAGTTTGRVSSADPVFASIRPKREKETLFDERTVARTGMITWRTFCEDYLPKVDQMWLYSGRQIHGCVITDAVNADAPPILAWDTEENRNTFSWIVMINAQPVERYNIEPMAWVKVNAIVRAPWKLNGSYNALLDAYMFVIDDARDTHYKDSLGAGLFAQILQERLREAHRSIHQFSEQQTLEGYDEGDMTGVSINEQACELSLRCRMRDGTIMQADIDRWK